jgi:extracellular factor (EF) 3-hydroxypalmitic acid methyl ester biosynthesis protein
METAKKKDKVQPIDFSTEVSLQEKTFLVHGSRQIPIYAECASKYSLLFRYKENHGFTNSEEPVNLLIKNNGQSVEVGPCRILPISKKNGYSGRLVFLSDVYDIKSLLEDNKIVNLQSVFKDLNFVLARKEKIKPYFKAFVADIKYDLQIYKTLFDDLDSQYSEEPEDVRMLIQKAVFNAEGDKFRQFLDIRLDELKHTVSDFSKEEHQCHGFYFRKQLWNFILCCPIFARSNLKPRGYPGDSQMMRMLYLNDYQGDSTFAKLFHKHGVGHPASQSVRNRIRLVGNLLGAFGNSAKGSPQKKLKVLSVGSGPAFELKEVLKSTQDCKKYHFTLLDQDSLAHSEAADLVHEIEARFDCNIDVDYQKCSVRTMLFSRKLVQKLGQFDFIYSMGLFDYLATPVAKAVIKHLLQLLKPTGEMVIGNFHVSNPSKYYMEYWCDWALFHRTEEEFVNMLEDCESTKTSVLYENTRSQMFLHIKK